MKKRTQTPLSGRVQELLRQSEDPAMQNIATHPQYLADTETTATQRNVDDSSSSDDEMMFSRHRPLSERFNISDERASSQIQALSQQRIRKDNGSILSHQLIPRPRSNSQARPNEMVDLEANLQPATSMGFMDSHDNTTVEENSDSEDTDNGKSLNRGGIATLHTLEGLEESRNHSHNDHNNVWASAWCCRASPVLKLLMGVCLIILLEYLIPISHAASVTPHASIASVGNVRDMSQSSRWSKYVSLTHDLLLGSPEEVECVVVGAGVTGITAATYLHNHFKTQQAAGARKRRVVLCDASDEVGGHFVSKNGKQRVKESLNILLIFFIFFCIFAVDGYIYEEGPNSMQPSHALLRLTRTLNLTDALVCADPSLPRFIYWDGKLHALPHSLAQFVWRWPLVSAWGKVRGVCGLLGLWDLRKKMDYDESIQEFATRHLGIMLRVVWFFRL